MPNEELSKKDIEKRILEAEKVVVSDMLHRWRRKYGMDYAILVLNKPGDVFTRLRVSDANREEVLKALTGMVKLLKAGTHF